MIPPWIIKDYAYRVEALEKRISSLVAMTGPVVTIAVTPWSNYDPINLPKILSLSTIAFGCLGIILTSRGFLVRIPLKYWFLFSAFPISLWIPFIFADSPKSQQFWGIFGRDTGLLTYTCLALILVSATYAALANQIEKINKCLIGTVFFVTFYGLIQAAGMDPIKWSQQNTFATLGNVNFLAAFLGIGVVPIFAVVIGGALNMAWRVSLLLLIGIDLVLIWNTDSIQGIVIALLGFLIVAYVRVRERKFWKLVRFPTLIFFTLSIYLVLLGLVKKGPFGWFLYQDSTVFRADYMRAALKMFQAHPLSGIGLDSYDGWYRRVRGFISAYRTGPNRTTNSSHNVILDLASGGGLIVLLTYLAILIVTLWVGSRSLKKSAKPSTWEIATFSAWCAYQVQSLVSINQISVGIWGWILTGLVIGNYLRRLELIRNDLAAVNSVRSKQEKRRSKNKMLSPQSAVLGIVFALLGFSLAFQPYRTDAAFRKGLETGDLNRLMNVSTMPAATAFHIAKILEVAYKNQRTDEATQLARLLTSRYPTEPFGWQIQASLSTVSNEVKEFSLKKLTEIDPWFACTDANSRERLLGWYGALKPEQKWEILQWWQVVEGQMKSVADLERFKANPRFNERINSFCLSS